MRTKVNADVIISGCEIHPAMHTVSRHVTAKAAVSEYEVCPTMHALDRRINTDMQIAFVHETAAAASIYDGVYEITPLVDAAQELNTANKILMQNVLVHEIPYAEVSNESGGLTVTIGE